MLTAPMYQPARISAPVLAAVFLAIITVLTIALPAAFVAVDVARGLAAHGPVMADLVPRSDLLLRTLLTVLIISVLAVALAWPAAWTARQWPASWLLILLLPMLLPSYLAYTGWGTMRAPGTWLGDIILRGPPGAGPGENWWPLAAARIQAIVGLTLWAWPLAAALLVARLRRLDRSILDALRLERISSPRRALTILNMTRGGTAIALGAVTLVMLGSTVPLHVAQFETYAMAIWFRIAETPHGQQWRIWLASWPLLAIAICAAALITGRIAAFDRINHDPGLGGRSPSTPIPGIIFTIALWALSIIVPAILLITALRSTQPLVRFWQLSAQSFAGSAGVAAAVAALALVITIAMWLAISGQRPWCRRLGFVIAGVLLAAGLTPGILVGAATSHAWTTLGLLIPAARDLADTPAILVIAHIARFGFVAALIGIFLALTEPRDLRDLRLLDAGPSLSGFVRAALPPQLGVLLASALVVGLLSFHEIEAAVILQPPSAVGGGLPWQMLQFLHFARMEDLSAAVLWVLAFASVTLAAVVAVGYLGAWWRRQI